jgi:hypothetical protein
MLSVVIIIQKKDENVNGSWQFCGSFFAFADIPRKFRKGRKKEAKTAPRFRLLPFSDIFEGCPRFSPVIE